MKVLRYVIIGLPIAIGSLYISDTWLSGWIGGLIYMAATAISDIIVSENKIKPIYHD